MKGNAAAGTLYAGARLTERTEAEPMRDGSVLNIVKLAHHI
ncbi:MAG: hypothetical protein QGM46_10385 [Actinomycetota bacterium]|nr:hypothetical protein [Actinomycetota bacterium]MDK1017745.1 hypothetical protein [Actinomycetota bacterium]MDK1027482.1 hypothetical protein [Actinomycetota bacterium]MDK1039323.1 hypothetical protein [Actinomycetota bacterium]MDK1097729.1 hypothetical protein [Actinomycetota bacterium]